MLGRACNRATQLSSGVSQTKNELKKAIAIGVAILSITIGYIILSNPLRKDEKSIEDYVLSITPKGTMFDDVK